MATGKSSGIICIYGCLFVVLSIGLTISVAAQDNPKAVDVVKGTVKSFEWIARQNKDTTWDEAEFWVDGLEVDGGGWRMPTIKELKTLYQEAKGTRNMDPLLKATGYYVWSGETKDSSLAWSFSIWDGEGSWSSRRLSFGGRAFAVRSRKLSKVQDCKTVSAGLAEPVFFTAPSKSGNTVQVQGVLRKPEGDRKFAALIVLHGQGGFTTPHCYGGATDRFTNWSYVTLLIDSTSQTDQSGVQVSDYSFEDQAYHAKGAAAFLASLPYVDSGRIGVIGWSTGGLATIIAIASPDPQGRRDSLIRAAVAFYPMCPANTRRIYAPLLVLIGERDTIVSASACQHLKEAVLDDNIQLVIYPNANHMFDAPWSSANSRSASKDAIERLRQHFETYMSTKQR